MNLHEFNEMPLAVAEHAVARCAAIPSWCAAVAGARPYDSREALLHHAETLAASWSDDEVEAALADHPRIGERREQQDELARHSEAEQAGVAQDASTTQRLRDANARYEQRFDRVFLIRAAGRDAEEILSELERRLQNDETVERAETAEQLRQIALLRLGQSIEDAPTQTAGGGAPSTVTTHVLDAGSGNPAAGVQVELTDAAGATVATARTDDDGRIKNLGPADLAPGIYRLRFATGAYFSARGVPTFYPEVTITFELTPGREHLHVPILLSPFAYSTYRGS